MRKVKTMNREYEQLLYEGAKELGVCLDEKQVRMMHTYAKLIIEWNRRFNLTAIKDMGDIVIKHLLDSLSIVPFIPRDASNFIDIGAGAGLPGIPVKLVRPHLEVFLVDSVGKKVSFMEEAIKQLELERTTAVKGRAEELGRIEKYREAFDVCAARAVASMNVLLEYTLPFVRVGGVFIAMKGKNIEEEMSQSKKALDVLGGKLEQVEHLTLPSTDIKRNIILIKKFRHVSPKYPRNTGKPLKQPLI